MVSLGISSSGEMNREKLCLPERSVRCEGLATVPVEKRNGIGLNWRFGRRA